MSATKDDYGPTREKSSTFAGSHGTEPADPVAPDHDARRSTPIAPASVKADRLPKPLREGGRPLTVDEAQETYLRTQRASWTSEGRSSKYERHRYQLYPRILEADRQISESFEGVTTAMLSRRLSPLDDRQNWLTPWEYDEMLHGGAIHKSIRQALNYHLVDYTFEWVAVTAPTRSAGTPHEHIYLWIADPEDDVTVDHLTPALNKHLKYCANAFEEHHRHRSDGTDGAITVQHDPETVEGVPDKLDAVLEQTESDSGWNTTGAQYLASQLAHLPLHDVYAGDRENPQQPLLEGAALGWASPHRWFRASSGVPEI